MEFGIAILSVLGFGLLVSAFDDDSNSRNSDENERVDGTDGYDLIETGSGDDTVFGGLGNDALLVGAGDDNAFGGRDADLVFGEADNDFLNGGNGDDNVFGGTGEDTLNGGNGNDTLVGADIIDAAGLFRAEQSGESELTEVDANSFIDLTADTGEVDVLNGGSGDDEFIVGSNDIVDTGEGFDTVELGEWIDPSAPAVITEFDTSTDSLVYSFEDTFPLEAEFVDSDGTPGLQIDGDVFALFPNSDLQDLQDNADVQFSWLELDPSSGHLIVGTNLDDVLTGTRLDDLFDAGSGDDIVSGGAGDDSVVAGDGDDIVQGQNGEDLIFGQNGSDFLLGRGGNDVIEGGAGSDWVEGDEGNDSLSGNMGEDTLVGGAGQDTLFGGAGVDELIGGTVPGAPLSTAELSQLRDGTATLADILGVAPGSALTLLDDNEADILNGRSGDDGLTFGAGDIVTGGTGADEFVVLENSAGNSAGLSTITDYAAQDDQLIVQLDADATETPAILIEEDGDDALLLLDGIAVTRIVGGAGNISESDVVVFNGLSVDFLGPA